MGSPTITPRWQVGLKELVLIVLAIVSSVSAWNAYKKIKNASSDVQSIVDNWNTKPIADWTVVNYGTSCPAGYESNDFIPFEGIATEATGCGCLPGSTAKISGKDNQVKQESGVKPCFTNQTSNANYKCQQIGGMNAIPQNTWRGGLFCFKRGFKSAIDTPYPDAKTGECPTGFHKCGSGTFNKDRGFCASDVDPGCPVTWLGSTNVLSTYTALTAGALSTGSACTATACPPEDSFDSPPSQQYYKQQGTTNVVGMAQGWSPLPIVDVKMAVESSTGGGPCYGDAKLVPNQGTFGSVTQGTDGILTQQLQPACETVDTRFRSANNWAATDYLAAKVAKTNYCASAPADASVFGTPGAACVDTLNVWSSCASGKPVVNNVCTSTDKLCRQAYTQTVCGTYTDMVKSVAAAQTGIFMRTQIYWNETCPYTYNQVVKNNGPLQKAIKWQTILLYLNIAVNIIMALFGLFILYIVYKSWNSPSHDSSVYMELEEVWKPRLEFLGTWVKVPIVIATIVFTSVIANFFVRLHKEACSDDMTNQTFKQLADALPGVIKSNIVVIVMDLLGLLPVLWVYIQACRGANKLENFDQLTHSDGPTKAVELAPVVPTPAAAPVHVPSAPVAPPVYYAPVAVAVPVPAAAKPSAPKGVEVRFTGGNVDQHGAAKHSGEGTMTWPDGSFYTGNIYKDMRHLEGTMTYAGSGEVYKGAWRDNKRHGKGTLSLHGRTLYSGEWFEDGKAN